MKQNIYIGQGGELDGCIFLEHWINLITIKRLMPTNYKVLIFSEDGHGNCKYFFYKHFITNDTKIVKIGVL